MILGSLHNATAYYLIQVVSFRAEASWVMSQPSFAAKDFPILIQDTGP